MNNSDVIVIHMKQRLCILLSFLCFAQVSSAFTRLTAEQYQFISLDGSVGYASLINNSETIKPGKGVAANIGVGYRFYRNYFLLSTGVEGYYLHNTYSMSDMKLNLDMIDTEGQPFVLTVDATGGSDECHTISLNLPILLGAEIKRFYFLVGPKLSYNFWGQAAMNGNMSLSADYERYILPFEDMPNHGLYKDRPIEESPKSLSWNFDVMAHAEIGVRLGEVDFLSGFDAFSSSVRYYLSVYADYGLMNIRKSGAVDKRMKFDESRQSEQNMIPIAFTPAIMSTEMGEAAVHQYQVGVKMTILFELPQKKGGTQWMH